MNSLSKNELLNKLFKFLDERRVGKGEEHTNTSMANPKGSFNISDKDYDKFLNLVNSIQNDDSICANLSLIEKHKDIGPIVIDLDFRYNEGINSRQYNIDDIKKILKLYYDSITDIFRIKKQDSLIAFIFEREEPYLSKDVLKDGVHIMFPKIISRPDVQYFLRESVLKKYTDELDNINISNPIIDVIDRSVIEKNGWFLYGSTKSGLKPYSLTNIFNCNLININPDEVDTEGMSDNMVKFFSIRRHEIETPVRGEIQDQLCKIIEKKIIKKLKVNNKIKNYDIEKIKELVSILSDSRADSYNTWIEVGWALHNINPDDQDLINIWIDFSKKSNKYIDGDCDKRWNDFKNEGFSLASIYFWAKQDNIDKFIEIQRKDICRYIQKSVNSNNYDIAKILYILFEHQYKCVSPSGKFGCWYEFYNHRWHKTEQGISLRRRICDENGISLVNEFCRYLSNLNTLLSNDDLDDTERQNIEKNMEKYTGISDRLKCTSFKDNLMKECIELFYDPKFEEKLDSNPYLLGFENGVFDLKNYEFRDGRPDDYITFSTKIDYYPFNKHDELVDDIFAFFDQIQPNKRIRDYLITELSSVLKGLNDEEKFRIWTGSGGNGKSKLVELITNSLGDYCIKLPITLLTGKRENSNAASPEVAGTKGKRFAYLEEPNEGEKINAGRMKEYSGGDKIKARGLYQDFVEFKPQFKMFLLTNDLPEAPGCDQGVWRRMEVVQFMSDFVDDPKEPHQFKKDSKLSEKLKIWPETFISILLEYFQNYMKYGNPVPIEVKQHTEDYHKTSDNYIEFIMTYLKETKNKQDKINLDELHDEFKFWYINEHNVSKHPSKKDLRKYLVKLYKKDKVTENYLKGFIMEKHVPGYITNDNNDDSDSFS